MAKYTKWKEEASNQDYKIFRLVLIICASVVLFADLFFLFYPDNIEWEWCPSLTSFLSSLLAALLCTIVLNVYELKRATKYDDHDVIHDQLSAIQNSLLIKDVGIKKVCSETTFDAENGFDDLFNNSKLAISILIHGRTFLRKHQKAIVSRFNRDGFITKCFFVNPESEFLKLVSLKTKNDVNEIKRYITDNVTNLIKEYKNSKKKGALEIYFMDLPPMQAVYIFDDTIVECKYYSSKEKAPSSYVTIYENKSNNDSIGKGFVDDSIKIERESKCVFHSSIECDDRFMSFLKDKFEVFDSVDWNNNKPNSLEFNKATSSTKTIFFALKYYHHIDEYESNNSFCISHFKKKEDLLGTKGSLYFITGVGGNPENPSIIYVYLYKQENGFVRKIAKSSNDMLKFSLRNFGLK